jgi:hypothetical protein
LADPAIQASAAKFIYRVARRVQKYGGANHRFRKRRILGLYRLVVKSHLALGLEFLHPNFESTSRTRFIIVPAVKYWV